MDYTFDTETALIGAEYGQTPPIACVQIGDARGETVVHWSEALPYVEGLLRYKHIANHTIAYDMTCCMAQWPHLTPLIFQAYEDNRIEDVAINAKLVGIALAERVYDPSLGELVKTYLGAGMNKASPWRLRFGELRPHALNLWPQEAIEYARDDVRKTWDLNVAIYDRVQRDGRPLLADRFAQARADFWLRLTSNYGLKTCPERVAQYEDKIRADHNAAQARLLAGGLVRQEKGKITRNIKAVQARFLPIAQARGSVPLTDGGQVSIAAEHLEVCGDPLLELYAEYAALDKKLATDIPILRHDVVHTRFDSLKATGRTGSGKDKDSSARASKRGETPNIQNFNRKSGIRECFEPRAGYCYAIGDYGKGELCTWSQICLWLFGHSRMAQVLNSKGDPHLEIASIILGCSYADALANASSERVDDSRQCGKVVNFGAPGGMGAVRLLDYAAKQYGVRLGSVTRAKELITHWLNTWPEARLYRSYIDALMAGRERITVEHFVSKRYRGGCSYTDASNSFFQGLLADAGKYAGFELAKACHVDTRSPLYGSHIVNYPHDEFVTEVPEDRAPWAADEQARIMVESAARYVPDVPPQVDAMLSRVWSKKVKPVRNKEGLLQVWEP